MTTSTQAADRFDRTLRIVMWSDAFLSVAMVVACIVAAPIAAVVPLPAAMRTAVGAVAIVSAVLLAAFGAITAVALMLRMRSGNYLLPAKLHVPLPPPMNPLNRREGGAGNTALASRAAGEF